MKRTSTILVSRVEGKHTARVSFHLFFPLSTGTSPYRAAHPVNEGASMGHVDRKLSSTLCLLDVCH